MLKKGYKKVCKKKSSIKSVKVSKKVTSKVTAWDHFLSNIARDRDCTLFKMCLGSTMIILNQCISGAHAIINFG